MSRLLCCLRARQPDMGAALSHPQEGEAFEAAGVPTAPPTMADVIRERKKKAGGAGLGTLRRRIAAAARRPRDNRPDRGGCEHARLVRATVSSWRLAEVFLVCEELEAGAAVRELMTRAELAREPASALSADLLTALEDRLWCDVELVGAGWSLPAHRVVLAARCTYFRDLLQRYPPGRCRVVLEGTYAGLTREELAACLCALYSGKPSCDLCAKCERASNSDGDLDIINMESSNSLRRAACSACGSGSVGRASGAGSRLGALSTALGFSADSLHRDMKYLLDSGELSDTRLVFVSEGGGGFRSALELDTHRLLLAARSRFFRGVLSRRSVSAGGAAGGATGINNVLCVDEKVLPRRFARVLLHAAYTDQVDLSLIGRSSSSPSSTNSTGSGTSSWGGVARGSGSTRSSSTSALEDAFALYEIGRFVEMPIVVQGCEDAIVEALSPDTLPLILRWSSASHASQWVHRQSMRYLRDEFSSIMSSSSSGRIPRAALSEALASPYLQAGELHALRALLRWAAAQHAHARPEPNVVWHTAHAQATSAGVAGIAGRRGAGGGRRREASEAALRDTLAPLLPLVRIEHLPPDTELVHQLVRRGILPAESCERAEAGTAAAWLGRGVCRPARCFLPYLEEMRALLEDQAVPEAEVARLKRERYLHRIPDTLYMVAAARNGAGGAASVAAGEESARRAGNADRWWLAARTVRALRTRMRELCAGHQQQCALALHRADPLPVYTQIALRAIREMSLPDSCVDLLLADVETERERGSDGWQTPSQEQARGDRGEGRSELPPDCCRNSWNASCSAPGTSSRVHHGNQHAAGADGARSNASKRELSYRPHANRPKMEWCPELGIARLSAAVPDVAMAPNANTHLLTSRDYFRHPLHSDYCGIGLQLDLGDGATHTPRPGSRAQRVNMLAPTSRNTAQHPPVAIFGFRSGPDADEIRAAIERSVLRAYSSLEVACANTLRASEAASLREQRSSSQAGARASAPASAPAGSAVPGGSGLTVSLPPRELHTPPIHHTPRAGSHSPTPSAELSRRRNDYSAYTRFHHSLRLEAAYNSSGSSSRGQSPINYA